MDVTPAVTRPRYHFAPVANWLSDPNGLVFLDGEWHLFYQYNPHGDQWGHMGWGHAISRDLLHWEERRPALIEDDRHLIFSGSAVVDRDDSAGFGRDALVAIYTGARPSGGHQAQCLAASGDRGRTWDKFASNPVLDRDAADFRDPNVFWHAPTNRWIMVVAMSAENRALIYASDDLKLWRELSAIGPFEMAGSVWECPLLIELPIEGGTATRWLFKVDLLSDGPGSGAIALTGTFDGDQFVADRDADGRPEIIVADGGRDFYAAIAWHEPRDEQGRPCWIGWMGNHGYQAALPARGWRGAMSLPRRVSLRPANGRYDLIQTVEASVRDAFRPSATITGSLLVTTIPAASQIVLARDIEARIAITLQDGEGGRVEIVLTASSVEIDRAAAIHPAYDSAFTSAPIVGDAVLWIDHAVLEIASADGARWISFQHCLAGTDLTLQIESATRFTIAVSVPSVGWTCQPAG